MPELQRLPLVELAQKLAAVKEAAEAAYHSLVAVSQAHVDLATESLRAVGEKGDAEARASLAEAELAEARREIARLKAEKKRENVNGLHHEGHEGHEERQRPGPVNGNGNGLTTKDGPEARTERRENGNGVSRGDAENGKA